MLKANDYIESVLARIRPIIYRLESFCFAGTETLLASVGHAHATNLRVVPVGGYFGVCFRLQRRKEADTVKGRC